MAMAAKERDEVVVGPEEATFWMDRRGYWCNRHGRFQHKKIIAYFHASIGRDAGGYFVSQINGDVREKVYFRHEDTALFVFDLKVADDIVLVLNTGRRMPLDPTALFIRHDELYARSDEGEVIKFNESSMVRISRYLTYEQDQCFLCFKGRRFSIPTEETASGETDLTPAAGGDRAGSGGGA